MTTASEKSSVEFTETGAIYKPGNGHVIEYKRVGNIYYHADTPDAVVQALEHARSSRQRVRIYYGDTKTGKDWLEERDIEGTISNSTGPLKVPLLIPNRRSHGGPALLDHCIVRIKWSKGGVLYEHPTYHTGTLTIRQIGSNEEVHGEKLLDLGYTHAVDHDGSNHANFRSLATAQRYVRRMTA